MYPTQETPTNGSNSELERFNSRLFLLVQQAFLSGLRNPKEMPISRLIAFRRIFISQGYGDWFQQELRKHVFQLFETSHKKEVNPC